MLEMDRILRPKGYVIIRDVPQFLDNAKAIGKALKWKCTKHASNKAEDAEGVLVCKKSFWTVSAEAETSDSSSGSR